MADSSPVSPLDPNNPNNPMAQMQQMQQALLGLLTLAIQAEERMHSAALESQEALLQAALRGAAEVSPENFSTLVSALADTTNAGISAQREVALAQVENGRQGLRVVETLGKAGLELYAKVRTARTARTARTEFGRFEDDADDDYPTNGATVEVV